MMHGYSRDGDTVTLTMSVGDYQTLLFNLAMWAGSAEGLPDLRDRIAFANRLNTGNPAFPYALPGEKP